MKKICKKLVNSKIFEQFIVVIILINCFLIGVETYFTNSIIYTIQIIALIIFIIEIFIRYIASENIKEYFSSGWNIFDLTIVIISLIPPDIFTNTSVVTTLRVLRVFRVFRLLKTNQEIRLIVNVLWRSINTLFYNLLFFLIFLYLFAVIGVTLFKLPVAEQAESDTYQTLKEYIVEVPNAPEVSPDPYYNLSETMFTLFRILTGEDWTDIRYNLIKASDKGLVNVPPWVITSYHVIWYIISAFLLLNLLVGAILNNYQLTMNEYKIK